MGRRSVQNHCQTSISDGTTPISAAVAYLRRRDVVSFQSFRFWKQVVFDIPAGILPPGRSPHRHGHASSVTTKMVGRSPRDRRQGRVTLARWPLGRAVSMKPPPTDGVRLTTAARTGVRQRQDVSNKCKARAQATSLPAAANGDFPTLNGKSKMTMTLSWSCRVRKVRL